MWRNGVVDVGTYASVLKMLLELVAALAQHGEDMEHVVL